MRKGTAIGRVRGLGSAREGTHHWLNQRITAGSNILLMTWLVISLARMQGFDHGSMIRWLSSPWVAVPMVLLIISVFSHFRLGLQTVIEDYQANEARVVALIALNLFTVAAAATAIFAVLRIALTGNAA